jgi:hypothetical protein
MAETSAADRDLARRATEAGWPTTASMARELAKAKILPPSVVTRRGRGVTTSAYPPEAVDVLLALRRATADVGRLRQRAVVLAWVRGAAVRDEGLRAALSKYLDEVEAQTNKMAAKAQRGETAHRKAVESVLASLVASPAEREHLLQATADLLRGGYVSMERATRVAETLAPMVSAILKVQPAIGATAPALGALMSSERHELLTAPFTGNAPLHLGAEHDEIDVSMTALTAALSACSREDLDYCRDTVHSFFPGDLSVADELGLASAAIGLLGSVSMFGHLFP